MIGAGVVILFLTVGALVLAAFAPSTPVQAVGQELSVEAVGLLVTVVVLQRLVDRRERRDRLLRSLAGIRQAGVALRGMADGWRGILEPGVARTGRAPRSLYALFSRDTTAVLESQFVQLSGQGSMATFGEPRARLRRVLETHGITLEPEYAEALEAVVDDPFWASFEQALGVPPARFPAAMKSIRRRREVFFERLLRGVSAQNATAREVARARSRSNRPRSDFLGVPLAADFDLRVPLILDSGAATHRAKSVDPMTDFD